VFGGQKITPKPSFSISFLQTKEKHMKKDYGSAIADYKSQITRNTLERIREKQLNACIGVHIWF